MDPNEYSGVDHIGQGMTLPADFLDMINPPTRTLTVNLPPRPGQTEAPVVVITIDQGSTKRGVDVKVTGSIHDDTEYDAVVGVIKVVI